MEDKINESAIKELKKYTNREELLIMVSRMVTANEARWKRINK